jgi:hypothetical protein
MVVVVWVSHFPVKKGAFDRRTCRHLCCGRRRNLPVQESFGLPPPPTKLDENREISNRANKNQ